MGRDALTPVEIKNNLGTSKGAGVAINTTNGAYIKAGYGPKVLLIVNNSFAGEKDVTVKAGDNPPAFRTDLGDLVEPLAQNETAIFVLESARFMQSDGTINIDYEADMTGTAWAVYLPGEF